MSESAATLDSKTEGLIAAAVREALEAKEKEDTEAAAREAAAAAESLLDTASLVPQRKPIAGLDDGGERKEQERKPAAGEGARTSYAYEMLYAGFSPEERKFRNPECDYQTVKFFAAVQSHNQQALREVLDWNAKVDDGLVDMLRLETGRHDLGREQLIRQVTTDPATGGALVPTPTALAIVQKKINVQVIGPQARNWPTPNTSISVPVEDTLSQPEQTGENKGGATNPPTNAFPESSPTYRSVDLVKQKQGHIALASWELIQDSPLGVATNIINQGGRKLAELADLQDWVQGDGVRPNQTEALLQNDSIGKSAQATLTYQDVKNMVFMIGALYRQNAAFYCERAVLSLLSQLQDGSGRDVLIHLGRDAVLSGNQPGVRGQGSMLGYMVYELPDGGQAGSGTWGNSNEVLLFGDMFEYFTTETPGIRVERSTEYKFQEDLIAWKIAQRRDSAVGQAEGFYGYTGIGAVG